MPLRGSCLCGGIRYEIRGPLGPALNCHCSMCRKATGAAFRTRVSVAAEDLIWISGYELLTRYRSSPGQYRSFCRVCGSTLVTFYENDPGSLKLALGTLDDDPGVSAECHVFVSSKAQWFEITDNLPQFESWPTDAKRFGISDRKSC
jgi:hypothetical protein